MDRYRPTPVAPEWLDLDICSVGRKARAFGARTSVSIAASLARVAAIALARWREWRAACH
jgi:hypothetical protein